MSVSEVVSNYNFVKVFVPCACRKHSLNMYRYAILRLIDESNYKVLYIFIRMYSSRLAVRSF